MNQIQILALFSFKLGLKAQFSKISFQDVFELRKYLVFARHKLPLIYSWTDFDQKVRILVF